MSDCVLCDPTLDAGGCGGGVRPWRRMISAILARSGGLSAGAAITAETSRKYSGPMIAGAMAQSADADFTPD